MKKGKLQQNKKGINPGRHEANCKICSHPLRAEIEQAFVSWTSPATIAKNYLISRDSIYRHAQLWI
jgi:hypothetical protein